MKLDYECEECGETLYGGFGDSVYCKHCNKCYETDWDYVSDGIACWIVKENKTPCHPNLKWGVLECTECDYSPDSVDED